MNAGVVILDTNIIHKVSVLDTLAYRATRKICEAVGIEMGITGITLAESINMQVTNAREWINQLERASRLLGEILDVNTFIPDIDEVRDRWTDILKEHFKIYTVEGSDAIEALRREALRLAPAKLNGQGSRDCAIWLTVLRLAREGRRVYLVTNNSKDFGDAPNLRSDLRDEADSHSAEIIYANSLQGLLAQISGGSLDTLAPSMLETSRVLGEAVKIQLLDYLQTADDSITRDEILDANVTFTNVQIVASYRVSDFTVVSIKFSFETESDDAQFPSVSGQAEAFIKFDNQFNDFRVAEPSDIRIIAGEVQRPASG